MDSTQLTYFKVVCEEKSFTKAAKRMFISPQGINKAIHRLEDELGAPLFENTPDGLILTECGYMLRSQVEPYLTLHNHIIDAVEVMKMRSNYKLSIGIKHGFSDILRKNFLCDFILQNPDIQTTISAFTAQALKAEMQDPSVKVWIVPGPFDTHSFEVLHENKAKMFLLASRSHPLAKYKAVSLEQISEYPLISTPNDFGQQAIQTERMSILQNSSPQYKLDCSDRDLIMALIQSGRAIGFNAGWYYTTYPDIVRIELSDLDITVSSYILLRKDAYLTDGIKRFKEFIKENTDA